MTKNGQTAQNKLMLLYLLREADIKLSENQLLRIVSENKWLSYFDFELSLQTLVENKMIDSRQLIHGHFYAINDIGRSTLSYFETELPYSLRSCISAYLDENRSSLEDESRLYAEYYAIGNGQYKVVLKIIEEEATVFEIDLLAGSKGLAQRYTENWRKCSGDLFRVCHETLTVQPTDS